MLGESNVERSERAGQSDSNSSVCYLFLGFTGDVSVEFGSVVGVAIFSNFGHAKVLAASTTAKIKNPIPIEIGSDAFSTSPRPNNRNTAPRPPKKAEPK